MHSIFSKDELKKTSILEKSLVYDSGIYWFRDYWSNRLNLSRNIPIEDFRIDEEKDFISGELTVGQVSAGKCNVQWKAGQFAAVVNPFELAHQLEPSRVSLSLKKPGLRDEAPDPSYNMKPEQIKNVVAEPVILSKGEARLWLQILLRIIVPSVILMLIEWAILSYVTALNPQLSRFSLTIMIVTLAAFIYSSLIFFVKIGISETTRSVIGAKATIYFYNGENPEKFHYKYSKDKPDWLESKPYWVFRYLFTWSFELTFEKGLPLVRAMKDIERLDVWCDAKTGSIEWVVSDYHWRELWYRPNSDLKGIRVWLPANFHTPKPLIIATEGKGTLMDLYRKGHPLAKEWMGTIEKYQLSHTKYLQTTYGKEKPRILNRVLLSQLSGLWWEKWRYQLGANNEIYKNHVISATGEQPTSFISAPTTVATPTPPTTGPTQTPTITHLAVTTVNSTENPLASSSKTYSIPKDKTSQSAISTVKQTDALTITRTATPSQVDKKKNAKTVLFAGIAVVAIASVTAIGLYLSKKQKKEPMIDDGNSSA